MKNHKHLLFKYIKQQIEIKNEYIGKYICKN